MVKSFAADVFVLVAVSVAVATFVPREVPPSHVYVSLFAGIALSVSMISTRRLKELTGSRHSGIDVSVYFVLFVAFFMVLNYCLLSVSVGLSIFNPVIGYLSEFRNGVYAHAYCWVASSLASTFIADTSMSVGSHQFLQ